MDTIGDRIKNLRKKLEISQKDLSDKTNISVSSINKYEMGIRKPKIETLQKIATALNTDLLSLTGANEVFKELDINPEKVYMKNVNGAIGTFIETPVEKTIPDDKALSYIREYIKFIAEQNNICMCSNEIDDSLPFIKQYIDTFIKYKLIEDHANNRGTQIK